MILKSNLEKNIGDRGLCAVVICENSMSKSLDSKKSFGEHASVNIGLNTDGGRAEFAGTVNGEARRLGARLKDLYRRSNPTIAVMRA